MNFLTLQKATVIWEDDEKTGNNSSVTQESRDSSFDYRLMYMLNSFVDGNRMKVEGRKFIGAGMLIKLDGNKAGPCQFFLFDNCLVHGEIVAPNAQYRQQVITPLSQLRIDSVPRECAMKILQNKKYYDLKYAWIISVGQSSFIVIAANKKEKCQWMVQIWRYQWIDKNKDVYLDETKNTALLIPYDYVSKCMCCRKIKFGIQQKKYHCIQCGFVVCKRCSAKRITFNSANLRVQRTCDTCEIKLTVIPKSETVIRRVKKSDAVVVSNSPTSRKSIIFDNELYEKVANVDYVGDPIENKRLSTISQSSFMSTPSLQSEWEKETSYDTDATIDEHQYEQIIGKEEAVPKIIVSAVSSASPTLSNKSSQSFNIACSSLQFENKILGKGFFGYVVKATHLQPFDCQFQPQAVACKVLHPDLYDIEKLTKAARVMARVNHPNIQSITGIAVYLNGCSILVSEYMGNGDLHSHLIKDGKTLKYDTLLGYSMQICIGMEHLHQLDLLHRNLATRNCLLDETWSIKISDNWLGDEASFQAFLKSNRAIPYRRLSPDVCAGQAFTKNDDIWAFGATVWEIFTLGGQENPKETDENKKRTDNCPNEIYDEIIQRCLNSKSTNGMNFIELQLLLQKCQKIQLENNRDLPQTPKQMEKFSSATSTLIRIFL